MTAVYRYPTTTVRMGFVLDLTFEPTPDTRVKIEDWNGWLLTCPENGFELKPPRSKLFLFAPAESEQTASERANYTAATRAYERWHKREARDVAVHEVPDKLIHLQGRVIRIGYRSDKWGKRGKFHDYDHDFREDGGRPPLLYTDAKSIARATGAVIVGGSMTITEGGIA